MKVSELIKVLQELPPDDYIAADYQISWSTKEDDIPLIRHICGVESPYDTTTPEFEYWNLG